MRSGKRRTEIQIDLHEIKIVRLRDKSGLPLCARCSEIVERIIEQERTMGGTEIERGERDLVGPSREVRSGIDHDRGNSLC